MNPPNIRLECRKYYTADIEQEARIGLMLLMHVAFMSFEGRTADCYGFPALTRPTRVGVS